MVRLLFVSPPDTPLPPFTFQHSSHITLQLCPEACLCGSRPSHTSHLTSLIPHRSHHSSHHIIHVTPPLSHYSLHTTHLTLTPLISYHPWTQLHMWGYPVLFLGGDCFKTLHKSIAPFLTSQAMILNDSDLARHNDFP